MKISDCCGVPAYSNGDGDTEDIGICPECKEHCEYIDDEDEDNQLQVTTPAILPEAE